MENRIIPPTNGWSSIGGGNNPPPSIRWVKDDYDEELIVEGAGVCEINGTYKRCGQNEDAISKYVKQVEYLGRNVEVMIHCLNGQQWYISMMSPASSSMNTTNVIDFYAAEDTSTCEDSAAAATADELSRLTISSPTNEEIKIINLPEWAIREIIDYIPKTSRALLALALTTDSASWRDIHWNKSAPKSILTWFKKGPTSRKKSMRPSAITKAILSPKNAEEADLWEEVNFEDNEKILCTHLTDDDIAGMLACINSVQKLKRLYLPYCTNITGIALEPLRGSAVLERLDLSLRRNRGYDFISRIQRQELSKIQVLPILYSIIGRQNHALKHIQFPYRWSPDCEEDSGYFERFLQQYNESDHQQNILCRNCNVDCINSLSLFRDDKKNRVGIQNYTCYDCLNHYCYNCKDDRDDGFFYLSFCEVCDKWRCRDCQVMQPCSNCINIIDIDVELNDSHLRNDVGFICNDCNDDSYTCKFCGDAFCPECQVSLVWCTICDGQGCDPCMDVLYCEHEGCEESQCYSCRDSQRDEDGVSLCYTCDSRFCFNHRLEDCKKDWRNSCSGCLKMIAPKLARGYEANQAAVAMVAVALDIVQQQQQQQQEEQESESTT